MLLSVIIPTRNRARRLANLLDSLAQQDPVEFEWEVIVVDNASTDMTPEVARKKSHVLPISIRHIREPQLGLHNGRHRGAKEAEGTFLGYLDDDMILAPTWVQGVEMVAQGQVDAVVGRILPKWEAQPPDWFLAFQDELYSYLGLLDLGTVKKPVDPYLVFGCNCFLPKRLIFELGGFHPDSVPADLLRYRGDGETGLMARFKQAGLCSYYDPRGLAYHIVGAERLTVEYFCKRAYIQGISNSFSQIRAAHVGENSPQLRRGPLYYLRRMREMTLVELLQSLVKRARRKVRSVIPTSIADIQKRLEVAERAGWQFHQDAVREDAELLRYVLRQDYFDESMK